MTKYKNKNGKTIEVLNGLNNKFIVGSVTSSGGHKRFKSPAMPPRETREDCQADLDAYAKKHKLKEE